MAESNNVAGRKLPVSLQSIGSLNINEAITYLPDFYFENCRNLEALIFQIHLLQLVKSCLKDVHRCRL
jgi:hypothetical protein